MKHVFCFTSLLALTACSFHHSGQNKFTEYAQTIPPITVPPGIKNPTADSYYPIPPLKVTAPMGTQPPLEPPGSQLVVHSKTQLPKPK